MKHINMEGHTNPSCYFLEIKIDVMTLEDKEYADCVEFVRNDFAHC